MTHGSLFAGVGGFDLGFEGAGWETRWQVEKEPFCRAVLATRFPKAERFDDIKQCGAHNLAPVECITAGVPCQDVSVAGKRAGLAGERTGLFYEFARILRELRPTWFVFENVPGLLSSNRGRDFAEVLRVLMAECGYGVCWRVLDSQFFGVAQRRRRVFVVGRFGKPCPAEVLFERAGGAGDIASGGEARERIAASPARRTDIVSQAISSKWSKGSSGPAGDEHHNLVCGPVKGASLSRRTVNSEEAADGFLVAASLRSADGHHGRSSPRGDGCDNLVAAYTVQQNDGGKHRRKDRPNGGMYVKEAERSLTLGSADQTLAIAATLDQAPRRRNRCDASDNWIVRAATDPDGVRDFAGLPEGLDSARYRALGNAVTVQVARWIAERMVVGMRPVLACGVH